MLAINMMKPLHLFGLTQKKKFSFRKWVTFLFISSAICISFVLVLKINEGKSGFPFCCSFYRYKMGPFCRNILWILLLPWNHAWLAQYLLLQVLVFAPRVGKCLHPGHPKFSKAPLLGPTRQAITLELPRRVGGGVGNWLRHHDDSLDILASTEDFLESAADASYSAAEKKDPCVPLL